MELVQGQYFLLLTFIINWNHKLHDYLLSLLYVKLQKIDIDNFEISSIFFVSIYIQINAITDTSGIEANIAPKNELLLDNSEITTINIAEI